MKKLIIMIVLISLCGCIGMANKINNIGLGMTKEEVIKIMGQPTSTSAKEGTEYLTYMLAETPGQLADTRYATPYFVRIVNGKVNAYGRVGDFDSTKTPEEKKTIDLNIQQK